MSNLAVIKWPQNGFVCKYYNICLPFKSDFNHLYDYAAFLVLQDKLKRLNIVDENYIQYDFCTYGEVGAINLKLTYIENEVLIDNIIDLIEILNRKDTFYNDNEDLYIQAAMILRKKQGLKIDFVNQIDSYLFNMNANLKGVENKLKYNDYIENNSFDKVYVSYIDDSNYVLKNKNTTKLEFKKLNLHLVNSNYVKEIVFKSPHLYSVYVMVASFKYKTNDFYKCKLVETLLSVLMFEYIRNYEGMTYTTECCIDIKRELIYVKAYIERNYLNKFTKYVTAICNNIIMKDLGKEKIDGLKICLKEMVLKMFDNPTELISFLTENNMYEYVDDINQFNYLISSITWDEIKYFISQIKFNLRLYWKK